MARGVVTRESTTGALDQNGTALGLINPAAVTAGTYGDSTHVAQITVNAAGQITAIANVSVSFPSAPVTSVFGRTGAVVATAGDYTGVAVGGTADALAAGALTNAMVNNSAAIAYSKLNLSGSIVNADVANAAAIAYSKLTLTGSIVNADVNAAAAIAYSKLNLATSIVQGDLAAALITSLSGYSTPWTVLVKTADQDATTATLATITDLTFTATSGKVYEIHFFPLYVNAGSSTPDIKFAAGEDSTTRGGLSVLPGFNTGDTFTNVGAFGDNQTATTALGADTNLRGAVLVGFHRGNGGTYGPMFAQNSADAGNKTTVKASSFLAYRQIN